MYSRPILSALGPSIPFPRSTFWIPSDVLTLDHLPQTGSLYVFHSRSRFPSPQSGLASSPPTVHRNKAACEADISVDRLSSDPTTMEAATVTSSSAPSSHADAVVPKEDALKLGASYKSIHAVKRAMQHYSATVDDGSRTFWKHDLRWLCRNSRSANISSYPGSSCPARIVFRLQGGHL